MNRRARIAVVAVAVTLVRIVAGGATVEAQQAVPILGSGSTFAEVALDAWASDLFVARSLSVDYSGNGSNGGLQNFQDRIVDFASSDVPYPEDAVISRNYAYTPIVAGGTALMYNLVDGTGRRIDNVRLTPQTIANIFFTKIRNWRDPAILAENPGLVDRMPDVEIRLGVRAGGSGTTGVFTDFLSTTAQTEWQTFLRESTARSYAGGNYITTWPDSTGSWNCQCSIFAGSSEIANWVSQSTRGSAGAIGYAEAAYAIQLNLPVVRIRNAAGQYRLPDARSVAVALLEATENGDGTQNLEDVHTSPREEAYPASSYNYVVLPTDGDFEPSKGVTLSEYLIYSVTVGQDKAADIGYSPLPPNLVQYALNSVNRINGHVQAPPLGQWGRAYERLTPEVVVDVPETPDNQAPVAPGGAPVGPGVGPGAPAPGGVDPGAVDPGAVDPGAVDPGAVDPGAVDPGAVDPGAVDPGAVDPGAVDPGAVDPGAVDPGAVDPGTGFAIDPNTGFALDPETGALIDPETGFTIDPETGLAVDPVTGQAIDPVTGQVVDPVTRAPTGATPGATTTTVAGARPGATGRTTATSIAADGSVVQLDDSASGGGGSRVALARGLQFDENGNVISKDGEPVPDVETIGVGQLLGIAAVLVALVLLPPLVVGGIIKRRREALGPVGQPAPV